MRLKETNTTEETLDRETNSPHQQLRKCIEKSFENMHTDRCGGFKRVLLWLQLCAAESAEEELKVHLSNFMGVTTKGITYNMTSLSTKSVLSKLQREFKQNGKKNFKSNCCWVETMFCHRRRRMTWFLNIQQVWEWY